MSKQLHVIFSGTVQGVGFRFTTERLARQFPVTGFVKNLSNGKVEVVAEGKKEDVEKFLAAVRASSLGRYIEDVEIEWREAQGKYSCFETAF